MKENEKIHIAGEPKEGVLTVLEGTAVVEQNPNEIHIKNGAITACAQFLEKKLESYQAINAHVEVNYEAGIIVLHLNEKDSNGLLDVITGSLERHPISDEMKINVKGSRMNRVQLIDLIREYRPFFVNKVQAAELINNLRDFTAKVNKRIEHKDDNDGNASDFLETVVSELEFEKTFELEIPIYKGAPKVRIKVEIIIDASSGGLQYYFLSDDLYEAIIEQREELLGEQIKELKKFDCSIVDVY